MRGGLCGKLYSQLSQLLFVYTSPAIDPRAKYSSRIAIFAYSTFIPRPVRGVPVGIFLLVE